MAVRPTLRSTRRETLLSFSLIFNLSEFLFINLENQEMCVVFKFSMWRIKNLRDLENSEKMATISGRERERHRVAKLGVLRADSLYHVIEEIEKNSLYVTCLAWDTIL